jgi:predicted phosphodiesterase
MIDPKKLICPNCYHIGMSKQGRCATTDKQRYGCIKCRSKTVFPIWDADHDIVRENVRLSKQKQKAQDNNRIYNKAFREHARIENAVEEYTKELITLFENNKLSKTTSKHRTSNKAVGVIQFSDVHFNELVELENNRYDFKVASSRVKHFVNKAKTYFKTANISNVVMALTGDLMNSDRRLDELLNQATNRANATFLGVDILQQAILDLNEDFNVTVASVIGNEGRANKEMGWSDVVASDNYDYTIFQCLRYLFRDSCVKFIHGDPSELVINVAGQNLLMLHGHGSLRGKLDSSVNQIAGRYSLKGIKIDYVIFGHVHSARVGDNFGRSSSMVGANDYSEKALNLNGRASQNCYIFYNDGNRDGIKVDLQNVKDKGYNIKESLEAYNAKSAKKRQKTKTIFEVVV